ncbi:MAG: redox-regulated ATPase YchF, partial [Clostridia bacterium]
PFCTIEPNVGIVDVPDERLNKLAKLYDSKKITPTQIEFVDIAGLVKGASRGEGLGNKFLSHIREVDAIVHVVRCFEDSNITHVEGNVDPIRDMETINLELIFADLESIQRRYEKAQSLKKVGDKKNADNVEVLEKICKCLESGKPVRSLAFEDDDAEFVKGLFLLTAKPVIYVANIKEEEILDGENLPMVLKLKQEAKVENAEVCVISAKIEEDLSLLPQDEREMFLSEYNLTESGLNKLVKSCYKLLGLISYLTAGEKETRAWTIERGTKAPQAAGKIHTDFEKGFIRAEVIDYEVLLEYGSYNACKEKGKVRSEGKEYVIKDGDVVLFRFNV